MVNVVGGGRSILSIESNPLQASMLLASLLPEGGLASLGLTRNSHRQHAQGEEGNANAAHIPNTLGDYALSDDLHPILNALFQQEQGGGKYNSVSSSLFESLPSFHPSQTSSFLQQTECAITQLPLIEVCVCFLFLTFFDVFFHIYTYII